MVPCEVTIHTGDCSGAGTDAAISMTVFGENGSSEVTFDKASDRFERAKVDLIKVGHYYNEQSPFISGAHTYSDT